MAGETRDWDKEMAAIDAVIAKGGYVAPSGGAATAPAQGGGAAVSAPSRPAASGGLRHFIAIWGRTLLGVALAIGLWKWPWAHACGAWLYFYLTGIGLLGLGALWVMRVSWVRRSGLSHLLGLLMLGYAVWLGTSEVLPRTGYAKIAHTWSCAAPTP